MVFIKPHLRVRYPSIFKRSASGTTRLSTINSAILHFDLVWLPRLSPPKLIWPGLRLVPSLAPLPSVMTFCPSNQTFPESVSLSVAW